MNLGSRGIGELALAGGREHTEEEFRQLLVDAGFVLRQMVPGPVVAVVEAMHHEKGGHG